MRCIVLTAIVLLTSLQLATNALPQCAAEDENEATRAVDYEREIKPLLFQKCAACHGALKQNSGLRLDAGELIRKGGDSGPTVVPGESTASMLIERVTAQDHSVRMPPEGQGEKLSESQIDLLKRWIDQGAVSPADEKIPEDPALYWSYQRPVRPAVPAVKNQTWVRNPIDAFIAVEHENQGLTPSEAAPRDVWLRRVFLDLTGLPPTREELHAFLQDQSDDAFEKVVDDLLARPAYGERWGRHWMDVWRYSDWYGSRGINEIRYSQRHIWRWRDWIVESLNDDKPYDQMVVEMLAGDELAPADAYVLRATGFLGRNWYKFDRNVWMFDTVEQTSQAFLGLTLKCARCHDHKFDPITQEDYYHFRAFFEPHDVRTDPVGGNADTEKDATLGPVLKEGVARAFDKVVDAKTFVFERGDNRYPDESKVMTPAVPKALGALASEIQPVTLSPDAWYAQLRSAVADGLITTSESKVTLAEQQITKARQDAALAEKAVVELQSRLGQEQAQTPNAADIASVLHDDFQSRSELWNVVSGNWSWQDGKLTESSVGSFATVVANIVHPRNFQARVRYRTLQPGTYRSVGFSFDYIDNGNSQDIYTSTGDAAQSVQAFHRDKGQQVYPQPGIVKTKLAVSDETTVEIAVRDQQLTITLNGEHKLDYTMPVARRDGKFALWVHSGSAEFLEVDIRELVPDFKDLQQRQITAIHQVQLAEAQRITAQHEVESIKARIAAERSKHFGEPEDVAKSKALTASRAERLVAVAKSSEEVLTAEQFLAGVRASSAASATPENSAAAIAEAEQKLSAAQQKLTDAKTAVDQADGTYAALGETFPRTSTGRRLALARWITSPENPRASRIAMNHIWLRHFGEALVPSVANFGLNGQQPSNQDLLDWLATELTKNRWQMKSLHRMIVLSSTYRQSSVTSIREGETPAEPVTHEETQSFAGASTSRMANIAADPANRFLWRMNSRRMEAEAVRDSILFAAGTLDSSRGGPEIPESEAQSNLRRSLYFRSTPNEKAGFLETFDAANPNECYRRQESVVPQQALALMNSRLALEHARHLAGKLSNDAGEGDTEDVRTSFIGAAFETLLNRAPTPSEVAACQIFLDRNTATVAATDLAVFSAGGESSQRTASTVAFLRARENLVHVLFSHNDFVTIR
jgi:mono/diheme cytochrome c family protein